MKHGERYFMASVKLGPKGQIVIPKEARKIFGVGPCDTAEKILNICCAK